MSYVNYLETRCTDLEKQNESLFEQLELTKSLLEHYKKPIIISTPKGNTQNHWCNLFVEFTKDEKIKKLEELLDITEEQRKEWARLTILYKGK